MKSIGMYKNAQKETDPTGKTLGEDGAKMDNGKIDLLTVLQQFPNALSEVSKICNYGAVKKGYGWEAWRSVTNGFTRYKRALLRHAIKDGVDSESKLLHSSHAAWNALAVLEFELKKLETES